MPQPVTTKIRPEDIADFFIALADESGDAMTNLKVQKLVYYAQAWHLALKNSPLFEEDFQAWVHGPVLPNLYFKFREKGIHGSAPIPVENSLDVVIEKLDAETVKFLFEVANEYMVFTGYALEEMTHQEDPWRIARGEVAADERSEEIISKESIQKFYAGKVKNPA